jgi:hypothetical protein
MAVIAAFIPYYWLPIRGEIAGATPTARRDRGGPLVYGASGRLI